MKRLTLAAKEALANEWLIHETKQGLAASLEPDQSSPERLADDKGARAVDRIDDPTIIGISAQRAVLLTDDAVRGIDLGERFPDRHFGGAVGGRNRIEEIASFMVNDEACPEMRQNNRAGPVGEGMRGGQKDIERRSIGTRHG